MNLGKRLKRETALEPIIHKGYTRKFAAAWYRKTSYDQKHYTETYGKKVLKKIHKQGYLAHSIEKYGLLSNQTSDAISDFDYLFLSPYNNSFSKWIGDMLTTKRVLKDLDLYFPQIYYTVTRRYNAPLILRVDHENTFYEPKDILSLIREKGDIMLRPAFWNSKHYRYKLSWKGNDYYLNDNLCDEKKICSILNSLMANYVVTDYVPLQHTFDEGLEGRHYLKVWLVNDMPGGPQLADAQMNLQLEDGSWTRIAFSTEDGSFELGDKRITLDYWQMIHNTLLSVGSTLPQLSYFSMSIALGRYGDFKFLNFASSPYLPEYDISPALNTYLKAKAKKKRENQHITLKMRMDAIHDSWFNRFVRRHCRKGIRPYMQKLWFNAVKADLFGTKDTSLRQKLWTWKRGFLSYRIKQYGLTEENYHDFLSDYDYHWLNRINNAYQIWVNDKTTFRYMLDPFMDCIPKYYYSIFRQNGELRITRMQDCPAEMPEGFDGFCQMLRRDGILALKPSAGTHGDGFYCLTYENGHYTANGQVVTEAELLDILEKRKSFYVLTEYIEMHPDLKKIYPKSVNSIRMMVINQHGYDPKIMQTYMRIGSSRTGFTDNVGYGGICVMCDIETGELYQPETITNHEFHPCPVHPDTGTPIAGVVPHWELIKSRVQDICRYLAELEYLGFDIAVTPDGFQVIEINIHQDLHKVPTYNSEVKQFFRGKIRIKSS